MRNEFFATGLVFPTSNLVFTYGVGKDIKDFYSNTVDNSLTDEAVKSKLDRIKKATDAQHVEFLQYSKTVMLILESMESLEQRGVVNLDQILTPNSKYEEMTKIQAIQEELSAFRQSMFTNAVFSFEINVDGKHNIRLFTFVIYCPNDWGEKTPSVSQGVARVMENSNKLSSMPLAHDKEKDLDDMVVSQITNQQIGATNAGSAVRRDEMSRLIHPFETKLVNMASAALSARVGGKVSTGPADAIRFTPITELAKLDAKVNKDNNTTLYTVEGNKLNIYASAADRIRDSDYLERARGNKPMEYDDASFKVTKPEALLIYAPPGAGKSFFLSNESALDVILDTDYSDDQGVADIILTNRHDLISKYNNTVAFEYDKTAWMHLVLSKIDADKVADSWYDDMLSNVSKAKHVIKMTGNAKISSAIKISFNSQKADSIIKVDMQAPKDADNVSVPDTERPQTSEEKKIVDKTENRKLTPEQSAVVDAIGKQEPVPHDQESSSEVAKKHIDKRGKKGLGSSNFFKK